MAHVRQSRPDYGLGFQVKVLKTRQVVPSSLGSGGYHDSVAANGAPDHEILLFLIVGFTLA